MNRFNPPNIQCFGILVNDRYVQIMQLEGLNWAACFYDIDRNQRMGAYVFGDTQAEVVAEISKEI